MESSAQLSIVEWLQHQDSLSFYTGQQTFSRHRETHYPQKAYRYRVVLADEQALEKLDAWLFLCSQTLSLAIITRASGLLCIEVCSMKTLDFSSLSSTANMEVYQIKIDSPVLNQPGLLVMDMDSTAIEIECIDELANMAGVGAAVAAVTEQAMQGELDFEHSLRARVAELSGADEAIIERLCGTLPLMPGLTQMLATLKYYQWRIVVASGGFTPFVNHLKQLLDLDAAFANTLDCRNGKLLGTVSGPIVDAQFKADTVASCAAQWSIAKGQRVAIGDGANDIPMVVGADLGIAYHGKPALAAVAAVNIEKLSLQALPYLFQMK